MKEAHDLKTWLIPFAALWAGLKFYEIRNNDRAYEVGDLLRLREYNHESEVYTGRYILAQVTYMTVGGTFGLSPDLCVMSIRELERGAVV